MSSGLSTTSQKTFSSGYTVAGKQQILQRVQLPDSQSSTNKTWSQGSEYWWVTVLYLRRNTEVQG
eukprot:11022635-Prorocentrum_lima.AAC.1